MSIKNKLNRLKPHIQREETREPMQSANSVSSELFIPNLEKWKQANVVPYFLDDGYCFTREIKYPISHQHGKYRFADFLTAVKGWNDSPFSHPLSTRGHSPEELFFFDTETTGLGGGVGNTIFILGSARFFKDSVILKQWILPHPGAEVPLYHSFLEEVNYSTLVTYNGKAFDWPQVKTRHTLIRDHVPKLPSFGHFDLYHAARRLWKHRLDKLKLSSVEQEILEVTRIEDIPGYLAPMIYFDYVENKEPEGMLGVIKHNELDILSLITLYTHISFQLLRMDDQQSKREVFEVGRWYSSIGETKIATKAFAEIAHENDLEGYRAKHAMAFEQKRIKLWNEAKTLWLDVLRTTEITLHVEACIELAKIFEHREKRYQEALELSQKAYDLLQNNKSLYRQKMQDKLLYETEKRVTRLENKVPGKK